MLYKYGAKIFKKIQSAMSPEFEDDPAFDPFDMWTGANFIVKKTGVGRDSNYDQSSFQNPAPLFEDDKKLEEIWKQEHSLKTFYDTTNFGTYDSLKTRFDRVNGNSSKDTGSSVPDGLEGFDGFDEGLKDSGKVDELDDMKFFESMGDDETPF